jgi:hypothetical protein
MSAREEHRFEHAGLACKVVLTRMGHHCGYVGLPQEHPWFGKSYSDVVTVSQEIIKRPIEIDKVGAINVFCAALKNTEESLSRGEIEMVLAVDVHGGLTYAGEREGLWWLGFDCAHSDDGRSEGDPGWKDRAYAEAETRSLADQLAKIGVPA